jgi:hypothetical protein
MKLKLLAFLPLLISIGEIAQAQTSGGPDKFGYHWANNLDPIGSAPVYNWKDIKSTGTLVTGLGDDNSAGPFDLKWYFNYYGQWHNTIWIGSNGWISFQDLGSISAPFATIPSASGSGNFIAGLLADLTLKDVNDSVVSGASVHWWSNHTDTLIVQYDSIPFFCDSCATGYAGRNSFQIILAGYSILFQYKQVLSTPAYDLNVSGLKTGIEDSTGNDGLQVLSDTFPSDSSAVKFFSPGTFSTNDLNNTGLSLNQNFPNPCRDFTVIDYSITKSESIKLSVHNMLGVQIETYAIEKRSAGNYSIRINTFNYPPGIYFYTLSVEGATSSGKMLVEK